MTTTRNVSLSVKLAQQLEIDLHWRWGTFQRASLFFLPPLLLQPQLQMRNVKKFMNGLSESPSFPPFEFSAFFATEKVFGEYVLQKGERERPKNSNVPRRRLQASLQLASVAQLNGIASSLVVNSQERFALWKCKFYAVMRNSNCRFVYLSHSSPSRLLLVANEFVELKLFDWGGTLIIVLWKKLLMTSHNEAQVSCVLNRSRYLLVATASLVRYTMPLMVGCRQMCSNCCSNWIPVESNWVRLGKEWESLLSSQTLALLSKPRCEETSGRK